MNLDAWTGFQMLTARSQSRDRCHGPFVFSLTDLHPYNIFVDDDWHITMVIDLEWVCVRPVEMGLLPVWLTGKQVDQLTQGEELVASSLILEELFDAFEREELAISCHSASASLITKTLRSNWKNAKFWFFHGLNRPEVLCNLFFQHILTGDRRLVA